MQCTRTTTASTILKQHSAASLLKALNRSATTGSSTRPAFVLIHQQHGDTRRQFSTTHRRGFATSTPMRLKEVFPQVETEQIKKSPPAWHHPIYTEAQMNAISIHHREVRDWSDRVALSAIRTLRWCMDLVTGYQHTPALRLHERDPKAAWEKYRMNERKYMVRNIFLESVAGVPGMVAGMLRHLRSMRRMKRDNGWMETLLEESYNERMHLLTFLKMADPGWFMRLMVLGAQGVFFNGFFLAYLISPRTCHRFVGYLEEEAVITYTSELADLDAGKLPQWEKLQAPDIAVQYWNMPEGHRSMRDLLLYIRADEAKHREVNHTLGNLDQKNDPNPYVSEYKDPSKPHPGKGHEFYRPAGWERDEVI